MALVIAGLGESDLANQFSGWVVAIFGVLLSIFYWGYYVFFEMLWNGQSPGKRWVGLRVIRTDGTPVTLSEVLIRNLVRIVDFLPAMYGAGIVTMFIDKQSRRLGDLAAGTLVIHDRAPISIQDLSTRRRASLRTEGLTVPFLEGFPVERLTNNDLNMIENFLQRREQLTHRDRLAVQILNTLHSRLGLPPPTLSRSEAEGTLAAILLAAQNQEKE
jgi:uncharacterized RDD family membrane protein YckC